MARQIFINIDTTLNQVQITDFDSGTGYVFLDYFGKVGQPVTMERENTLALTNLNARIKFTTIIGSTMLFSYQDISDVQIDGVSTGPADLADVLAAIGPYIWTSVGGGCTGVAMFEFGVGKQNNVEGRINWIGDIVDVSLTNVTSYTLHKNEVLVPQPIAFPLSITQNDRLYVTVVRTNPAALASVDFLVEGVSGLLKYPSLDYYYPMSTIFTETVVRLPNEFNETSLAFRADNPTINWYANYIASNPLVDNFELIIPPNTPLSTAGATVFGLNDQSGSNTPAGRPNRTSYFFGLLPNVWQIYEKPNTLKAQLSFNLTTGNWFKIVGTVVAGVGTITYYRSTDNGVTWTLLYTSLTTYAAGTSFYYDFQHVLGSGSYVRFVSARHVQL
jgi:hypothetical protein